MYKEPCNKAKKIFKWERKLIFLSFLNRLYMKKKKTLLILLGVYLIFNASNWEKAQRLWDRDQKHDEDQGK